MKVLCISTEEALVLEVPMNERDGHSQQVYFGVTCQLSSKANDVLWSAT